MSAHGTVHWNELNTWEPEKAVEFYGKAMGWTFEKMPMPDGTDYYLAMRGEEMVGGIFTLTKPEMEGVPDHWFTYFAVDDVAASCEALKSDGGKVIREPWYMPGTGHIAIVSDPIGTVMGLMTPE
jgi:hypothetical protein